jgi:hypothetical protein
MASAAAPVKVDYRVSEAEFASADRKKIEAAAKDLRLLAALDSMRQKRQRLTSIAERIQSLDLGMKGNLFTSMKSQSAIFKWQQPVSFTPTSARSCCPATLSDRIRWRSLVVSCRIEQWEESPSLSGE